MTLTNYGTHFREWYRKQPFFKRAAQAPKHLQGVIGAYDLAYEYLGKAQFFKLPDGGRIIDEKAVYDFKYAALMRLPYPVTAFEYTMEWGYGVPESNWESKKRISLCFDDDAFRHCIPDHLKDKKGFFVLSVAHASKEVQAKCPMEWAVIPAMGFVPAEESRFENGKLVINAVHWQLVGGYPEEASSNDLSDEMQAAIQTCAALNCSNVATAVEPASPSLNAKRVKAGKEPFNSYRLLVLSGTRNETGESGSGHHASPRFHLRRGHIRRVSDTRTTWVNACTVGRAELGAVTKDYRVAP